MLYRVSGQFLEAKSSAERALEADPFLEDAQTVTFRLYEASLELKYITEATRWCEEGRRRFPNAYSFASCALFTLALSRGPDPDVEKAWALLDTMLTLAPPLERDQLQLLGQMWVAGVLARAGLADSAIAVSEHAQAAAGEHLKPWIHYHAANVQLLLGRHDEALLLLEGLLEALPQRREYIAKDWMFEELWEDPRFKALVGTE